MVDYSVNTELCDTVMFRLFDGADSPAKIVFRWTRNYSVIMYSELVDKLCGRFSRR
jgi:hypothetical protein